MSFGSPVFLAGCAKSHVSVAPKAWLQAEPGMSKAQLHQLLGEPQSSQPVQYTENWRVNDNWKLIVTYDANGNVKNVVNSRGL